MTLRLRLFRTVLVLTSHSSRLQAILPSVRKALPMSSRMIPRSQRIWFAKAKPPQLNSSNNRTNRVRD